jgi:hypothetical protein
MTVVPNLYYTKKNKEVQEHLRNCGGIDCLVNQLYDADEKLILNTLTTLIAAIENSKSILFQTLTHR